MSTESKRTDYRTINLKPETFHRLTMAKLDMELGEHRAISHDEFLGIMLDRLAGTAAPVRQVAGYA
jgi:hypothetical protein